jgi:hypothetical protein
LCNRSRRGDYPGADNALIATSQRLTKNEEQEKMRLKVHVKQSFSQEDLAQLKMLGCEDKPFIERGEEALFAATSEHEEQLRALDCVLNVESMPVYRIGVDFSA